MRSAYLLAAALVAAVALSPLLAGNNDEGPYRGGFEVLLTPKSLHLDVIMRFKANTARAGIHVSCGRWRGWWVTIRTFRRVTVEAYVSSFFPPNASSPHVYMLYSKIRSYTTISMTWYPSDIITIYINGRRLILDEGNLTFKPCENYKVDGFVLNAYSITGFTAHAEARVDGGGAREYIRIWNLTNWQVVKDIHTDKPVYVVVSGPARQGVYTMFSVYAFTNGGRVYAYLKGDPTLKINASPPREHGGVAPCIAWCMHLP